MKKKRKLSGGLRIIRHRPDLPDRTDSHERIRMIAKEAKGFVYCVSSLGVTGVRSEIKTDVAKMVENGERK